ncbi:N-acetylmuramoyl-L-alanine amidase OS=Ureibacillus acetophenoni OX=614649 GN=SAMN05877842_101142 PE=4 SV=1 [Ureibacillus acetophenoni]
MAMKKHLRILIVFMLTLTLFIVNNVNSVKASSYFEDVPTSHEAYEAINYIKSKGIAGGYFEGGKYLYKPDHLTTRSQVSIMLVNAKGYPKVKGKKSSYIDVATGTGLSEYVETVKERDLLVKQLSTKFYPYLIVSLKEVSLLIAKAYNLDYEKYSTYPLPFEDIEMSDPYYKYVSALYYEGIIEGDIEAKKVNKKSITRGEFAIILARANNPEFRLDPPVQGIIKPEFKGQVVVTDNYLNVRSTPDSSISTNKIGQVNTGDKFNVYEEINDWLKIDYKGQVAYIAKAYTKYVTTEDNGEEKPTTPPVVDPNPTPSGNLIGKVTVNSLHVRTGPGTSYDSLGKLNTGDIVTVYSVSNDWANIQFGSQKGYVHKSYLKLINTTGSPVQNRIIVLDPGHGAHDPGANYSSYTEKEIVLKVGNLVKQKLEAAGAKVVMTRSADTFLSLDERVEFTKKNYGELFLYQQRIK